MIDNRIMIGSDLEEYSLINDTKTPLNSFVYELSTYYWPSIDRNRLTLITAYCVLFVLGLLGNVYVTVVVGRVFRQTRTEAPKSVQIFILSLCVCELIMLPFLIFLICDLIFGRWIIQSRFLCRLYLSSEGMNKFCSPFLLASLSGFCYVRLRGTPTSAHSITSTRRASFLVLFCLFLSIILMTPIYEYGDLYYLIEFNETHVLNVVTKCAFHPPERIMIIFTSYGFAAGYVLPAALFTFFYAAALTSARRQRKRSSCYQNPPPPPPNQQYESNIVGELQRQSSNRRLDGSSQNGHDPLVTNGSPYLRRVRTTTFGLIFCYLTCWTPYWSMALYHCLTPHELHGYENQSTIVISYFIHMLPYANCVFYPVVYTLINSHLKKDYKRAKESEKRRRLAGRKPRGRLPIPTVLSNFKMRNSKYSSHSLMTAQTTTMSEIININRNGSQDTSATRINLDDSSIVLGGSGYRRSSSCQLFTPIEDRFFFSKASLHRTLTPALSVNSHRHDNTNV